MKHISRAVTHFEFTFGIEEEEYSGKPYNSSYGDYDYDSDIKSDDSYEYNPEDDPLPDDVVHIVQKHIARTYIRGLLIINRLENGEFFAETFISHTPVDVSGVIDLLHIHHPLSGPVKQLAVATRFFRCGDGSLSAKRLTLIPGTLLEELRADVA